MQKRFTCSIIAFSVLVTLLANSFIIISKYPNSIFIIIAILLFINFFAGIFALKTKSFKLKICAHGTTLLFSFYASVIISIIFHIYLLIKYAIEEPMLFHLSAVLCIIVNAVIFWNGIICVYLTSTQLGIKIRVIGIIMGMIPIANLVALYFIIKSTFNECVLESEKEILNDSRHDQNICETKYPILMVHGVFFRDSKYLNYWGRIPNELEKNGARIFYGNHCSASSIEDSAAELTKRIDEILKITGEEKVNIIAHSKGGLDCRYAISNPETAEKVASLTTINTPHRGCLFADYLLTKISDNVKNKVADTYNSTLKKFGERNSDFLTAVNNLTESYCIQLNSNIALPNNVYCQSVGSVLRKATNGKFPLNFSYHLVKHFSGKNDGLVSESSFKWGEKYTLLKPTAKRGISHGDMIDLNRENIPGFDVREFYVELVHDLKERGL